jgi:copper transport protein
MRRIVILAALGALTLPAQALAHASIQGSSPSPRERFDRAPREVTISFDQSVKVFPNGIRVYDAQGNVLSYAVGTRDDGRTIAAAVRQLERGPYTVRWQALSADGHAVAGVFTFGVGVAAPPPSEAYGAKGPTRSADVVRWLYFVSLALLIGGLGFRLLVLDGPLPERLERQITIATLVGGVAAVEVGVAAFLLRAQDALQLPFGTFLYGDLSPFAYGTRFGLAFVVMTLGLALVIALVFLEWLTERRGLLWPAFALSLLLASGLSLSGHSAVDRGASAWSQLADWAHLVAASLWAGGLMMLLLVFVTAPGLRRRAFARFARIAPVLIAVLVAAGTYLSILRLPSLDDLWTTGYGQVLLVKLALVAVALAWGAAHHFVVEPRLDRPGVLSRLPGSLAGEAAVGMAVLLLAAVLVNAAPPPEPPAADKTVAVSR